MNLAKLTLAALLFLTLPDAAGAEPPMAGPGWINRTAHPVSPEAAEKYFSERRQSIQHVSLQRRQPGKQSWAPGASPATALTVEMVELARGLEHDPKLIYDYVRNHVEFTPYFGSRKGATLTYYDGAGNDADQASLMIALLRASGYSAQYVYGTMTAPYETIANWVGSSNNAPLVLSSAGIPFQLSPLSGEVCLTRVWVRAWINGTACDFDPAIKTYARGSRIDLAQAMAYSRDGLLSAMGGVFTEHYAQNLDETRLADKLTEFSTNLVNALHRQCPNARLRDILGQRYIVETSLAAYPSSLTFPSVVQNVWDDIPPTYSATLRVQHHGIDHTFTVPEIGGKRLTVTYAGGDLHPELRLDGEWVASGAATSQGSCSDLVLTIDHPYAADGGAFADQTATYPARSGATYAIISDFGATSDRLLSRRQRLLDQQVAAGQLDTSETVLGETLNVVGLSYWKQWRLAERLWESIGDNVTVVHHFVGCMCQEKSCYIDLKLFYHSTVPSGESVRRSFIRNHRFTGFASALEHGVIEQSMGTNIVAISTVKLIEMANARGNRVFLLDSNNVAEVRAQLANYPASLLDKLEADVRSGAAPWVILPENAAMTVNQWQGYAYLEATGTKQGAWAICGDMFGGYPSVDQGLRLLDVCSSTSWHFNQSMDCATLHEKTPEPVDVLTGAFVSSSTDLTLGGAPPRGLRLDRSYNSSAALQRRALGNGWAHSGDVYVQRISRPDPVLGTRQPRDAAPLLVALYAINDLPPEAKHFRAEMACILINKWAMDRLRNNAVHIRIGGELLEFTRQADGAFSAPPGIVAHLLDNPDGSFTLLDRFGTRTDFNLRDRAAALTDIDGNSITYTYDSNTNVIAMRDSFGHSLVFNYHGDLLTSVSDSAGRTVSYVYDGKKNLVFCLDPAGKAWGYGYDQLNRMVSLSNPLGVTTASNEYDGFGRVVRQWMPRQGGSNAAYSIFYSGYRNSQLDPLGGRIVYLFDGAGNLTGKRDPLGNLSANEYDGQNHVVMARDPRGVATAFVYDADHNLVALVDGQGNRTRNVYDGSFRQTDVIDPLGRRSHVEYDARHRAISTTDAVGNGTAATYYDNGLQASSTTARGVTTVLTYDSSGCPRSAQVGDHPPLLYGYDHVGRLTNITDQVGNTASFVYDARGLVVERTDWLGRTTRFGYDDAGRLSWVRDRNGDTVTYEYTPTDKVSRIRPPRSGDIEFAYDVLDNCVSMTDWVGTTRYEHDANGSVTSVSDPHGFTVKCAYDAAGNPVAVTYPDGKLVTYGYDELRRLTAVTNWLGQVATWEYDGGARLFQARGFNGTTTKYSWDEVNRLIALENRRGDGQLIALYRFGLDQDGNRTNLVRSEPLYPGALGQTTAYAYDAQRVRLLEAGGRQFTWDGEGQLLRKDNVTFGFDELHRLVSVSGPVALRFAYDGAHHRLEATRGGVATRYVYDPLGRVIAEADSANKITRYYIWGAGLLALAMPSGEVYTYHFDPNGSTVALTDQSQSSICLYSYSPFGEVTAEQETVPQPFRFVGQHGVWAEANGLYQMGARYYDAPIGRFISQDPAGVEATGPNLYAYAGNNPISNIDPTGRSSLIAAGTKVLIAEIAVVTGLAAEVARSGDQFTWQKGVEVGASTVAGVGVGLAVTGLTLNPVLGAVAGAATAELTGQVIQTCNGERTNFDFASYGMAVGVAAIPLPGVGSLGAIEKQIFTKLALDQIHYMLPSTAAKIVLAEALPALFGEGAKSIFQKTTKGK